MTRVRWAINRGAAQTDLYTLPGRQSAAKEACHADPVGATEGAKPHLDDVFGISLSDDRVGTGARAGRDEADLVCAKTRQWMGCTVVEGDGRDGHLCALRWHSSRHGARVADDVAVRRGKVAHWRVNAEKVNVVVFSEDIGQCLTCRDVIHVMMALPSIAGRGHNTIAIIVN